VLLVLSPRLPRWTTGVTGTVVPAVLAGAYTVIVAATWAGSEGGPCLVATFLFGPAGWLLYGIVRSTRGAEAVAQRAF